MAGSSHQS